MMEIYTMLATGGLSRSLRMIQQDYPDHGQQRLRPEAAYIVSRILSEVKRPDLPLSWEFSQHHGRVAFKTGTSFGFRDAWCLGYTPAYTVGVWFGNVNAQGSNVLKARDVAAPVCVEIFNQLLRNRDE